MQGRRWWSWLVAALLGLGVVATMPARAWGAPGNKPAANVKDPAEARRLDGEAIGASVKGKHDEAIGLLERALSLREQALGPNHPMVATSLDNLAKEYYYYKQDNTRAEALYHRALRIREKALGSDHLDVATSLDQLARVYKFGKPYDARAEALCQRALRIREKALGPDHLDVATSLDNLAWLYTYKKEDYTQAEALYQRALRIREKALGPDHLNVVTSLENLASLCVNKKKDYTQAEALYQRALRIREKALGPDHLDVATSLNNLARLYDKKADYARAEPLYQRVLRIREIALGPDHLDVAFALEPLALRSNIRGDYAQTEALYQRALRIREKAWGTDDPRLDPYVYDLAKMYKVRGNYTQAEPLYQRVLRIREKAQGPDHPAVADSLNDLAGLYIKKGDYARAEPDLERALRIREKALGPDHSKVAFSLKSLAILYREKGDYMRSEPLFERALRILEKAQGPDHPNVGVVLGELAVLYEKKGDDVRAQPLFQRALSIFEKALGIVEKEMEPGHPDVARILNVLAVLYVTQGRLPDAVQARQRSLAIEDHNATLNLATGSEMQKRAYMATLKDSTDLTISLHVKEAPSNGQAARLALTTILQRKGRVLDVLTNSLAALRRHLAPSDQDVFDRFSFVRSQLAIQLWRGPDKLSTEQYKKNLQDLEAERQKLEEELGQRSAAVRARQQPLTLEQVQKAIPAGAALLEIFHFRSYDIKTDRSGSPRYVAYLLRRQGEPSFVDLGEATRIDAAVQKLRAALADSHRAHDPKAESRALDALVMQPIRKRLGDTRWVLLSPDGDLNLVPFEALVDEQGRYLIERFAFTYLTSGRDLVQLEEHADRTHGAVVIADPDFGLAGASTPGPRQDATHRGLRSVDMTRTSFIPLPSTAEEARAIAHDLPGADVLLGAQATEGAIKAVQGPRILHLATHGFFLPREPESKPPNERPLDLGLESAPQEIAALLQRENPLLRAGLALAGANTRISGDKDDGILTALEVSGLDLYGTKLVVLSACETGVGEAVSGEGVYGLRRALVMAGAETQVMSLWKVDTGRTRELMIAYYEKLKAGAGRSEALRQVQLEMLERKETSHPNLWASFIVSGDWRTLDGAPVMPDLRVRPGPRGCACAQAGAGGAESWPGAALLALTVSVVAGRRRARRRECRSAVIL